MVRSVRGERYSVPPVLVRTRIALLKHNKRLRWWFVQATTILGHLDQSHDGTIAFGLNLYSVLSVLTTLKI